MGTIYTIALSVALGGNPGLPSNGIIYPSPESVPVIQEGGLTGAYQNGNYQNGNYQNGNYQNGNYQNGNYQNGNYQGNGRCAIPPAPYVEAVGGIYGDELYPYDAHYPWLHGYFQEMPAYGGYKSFRPYNYKHIMSQSKTAAGWGLSPQMPYSQQFWHRYQYRASMEHQLSKNKALEKAEYTKELARLKARLDFEKAKSISQQRQLQNGVRQVSSENNSVQTGSFQNNVVPATNRSPIIRPGKSNR
jgi:hypothetical protein